MSPTWLFDVFSSSFPSSAELGGQQRLRLLARALLQGRAQLAAQRERQRHGHCIPDLAVLVVNIAIEAEAVREALQDQDLSVSHVSQIAPFPAT